MTEQKIIEGNKLIAEFMSGKLMPTGNVMHVNINYWLFPNGTSCPEGREQYHTSWDWLMPVVEKINDIDNQADRFFYKEDERKKLEILTTSILCHREEVYNRVIQLIKWYKSRLK